MMGKRISRVQDRIVCGSELVGGIDAITTHLGTVPRRSTKCNYQGTYVSYSYSSMYSNCALSASLQAVLLGSATRACSVHAR